ncbi:hypothetical protein NtRootA9_01340 [Arthrobacter sp. NtRootA9]|nr:hypothetical protein NtRootA9_01340 [Arthrobacter sp. NtRootA9]
MTLESSVIQSSQHTAMGLKYRKNSVIFGVLGLFVFGIALGVLAFINARRAEEHGVKATAGKVLGVLGFISGIVVMTIFVSNR